jgi:hypothetical protein
MLRISAQILARYRKYLSQNGEGKVAIATDIPVFIHTITLAN